MRKSISSSNVALREIREKTCELSLSLALYLFLSFSLEFITLFLHSLSVEEVRARNDNLVCKKYSLSLSLSLSVSLSLSFSLYLSIYLYLFLSAKRSLEFLARALRSHPANFLLPRFSARVRQSAKLLRWPFAFFFLHLFWIQSRLAASCVDIDGSLEFSFSDFSDVSHSSKTFASVICRSTKYLPFLPSERTWGDFLIYAPLAHDVNPELLRYSFISREKVNDYFPLLAFFLIN